MIYGLDMLDSWLYDETRPFDYLKQISVFEELKARISQGYFEKLIRTYLLENPHGAVIVLEPERGLAEKRERGDGGKAGGLQGVSGQSGDPESGTGHRGTEGLSGIRGQSGGY